MTTTIQVESKLTDRYQTTVPAMVRRSPGLGKRDKINYSIRPNGEVVLSRAEVAEVDDPLLGHFLEFLSNDIAQHPERLRALDVRLVQRLKSLTSGVELALDAPANGSR